MAAEAMMKMVDLVVLTKEGPTTGIRGAGGQPRGGGTQTIYCCSSKKIRWKIW